ncbi:D-alanyl-D-alanine carboxypeptidase family protein [Streptomyces sp. NPDC050418]|uniref:D-alanyl-D-alanine carboxypeptidase family protein n=1 Tax=Streptomyces sp. NPDC050418 TaxID=3365612 RepID=UPI00378CE262
MSVRSRVRPALCALLALTATVTAAPDVAADATGAGPPRLPRLSARAWVVADAGRGQVLASYRPHQRLAPASTIKSLFALTVLPRLDGATRHRVTAKDLAGMGAGSSQVGVRIGGTYRVRDLWRGTFLRSGNDAVRVLARMNGGWAHTARQMNAEARRIGARNTHVVSPDGYDARGQYSSAYDLTLFGRAGLRDRQFAYYCGSAYGYFPMPGGRWQRIDSTNRLLAGSHGVRRYRGVIGIKNGYTTQAGNTLIVAARRGGRTIVATVLNPTSGVRNGVYTEARALLDWGFAAAGKVKPVMWLPKARG